MPDVVPGCCINSSVHAHGHEDRTIPYIITTTLSQENGEPGQVGCVVLVTFYNYFSVTNFFWMLVEGKGDDNYYWMGMDNLIMHCLATPRFVLAGLYLYMLVVETFSGDNTRFKTYAAIGWGES